MYDNLIIASYLTRGKFYVEEHRPCGAAGVLLYRRVINRALPRLAVRASL